MPREIAIPFRVSLDGQVVTTSDQDVQVRQHVNALINTEPTERAGVPGYGTPLHNLLFEGVDGDDVAIQAEALLQTAFVTWEPGVRLDGVEAVAEESEDNSAVVDVKYSRLDAADSGGAVNANIAIIGANGTVREVVRG